MKEKVIYIYCLIDPATWAPFYVGKTCNLEQRLSAHLAKAKSPGRNLMETEKHRKIRSILRAGDTPKIALLKRTTDSVSYIWEKYYYSRITEQGHELLQKPYGLTQEYYQEMKRNIINRSQ